MFRYLKTFFRAVGLVACLVPITAHADLRWGGKLMLTRGVTNVEGTGGGGIASWALITGNQTRDGIGASAFGSYVFLPDYEIAAYGVAAGFYERVEISFARQDFHTGDTGALLGLGEGFTFSQNIFGAKVRLFGDAVYDSDTWLPQVAVGVQHKRGSEDGLVQLLGAKKAHGTDFYVSATKLILDPGILLSATARLTNANQGGLLGFGGDQQDSRTLQLEGSIGYLVSRRLLVGAEYRTKPDNLGFAEENDWFDVYAAYAVNDYITVTGAYVDLGSIATFDGQRGAYFSLQLGY